MTEPLIFALTGWDIVIVSTLIVAGMVAIRWDRRR